MQRTTARLPRLTRRGVPVLLLAFVIVSVTLAGIGHERAALRSVSAPVVTAGTTTKVRPALRALAPATVPAPRVHVADVTPTVARQVSLKGGRKYLLLAHQGQPAPLVIALHGYLNTPTDLDKASGLSALARSQDFTLVYGEGVRLSWNSGFACCGTAVREGVDDVAYVSQVIADASKRATVDPNRIYLIGFSDGGMLAERAACALPQVAAAVSVAGPLLVPCRRAVKLLHIHGRNDHVVPLAGGFSQLTQTTFPSSQKEGARLPAGSLWSLVIWPGGHAWPSAAKGAPINGNTVDATALAWAFFQKHPLRPASRTAVRPA